MLKQWSVWTLLTILLWTGQSVLAQAKTGSAVVVNLRTYGWEPPGPHELTIPSIAVDNEGRVLVGFTVRARTGLVTRGQPSLDFRVMRFSPDGKVDLSLSLPTHVKGTNGVYLSDTDQIIARANDSLQFLKTDDGNLQKGVWETLCAQPCGASQSPTRRTLVLHTKDAGPSLTVIRFLPQPVLQQCGKAPQFGKSSADRIQNYTQFITDKFAYFHGWEPESGYFTYRWPLCDYEHRVEMPLRVGGRWAVLNDDTFVVYSYSKSTKDEELEVISSDGRVKFRPTMEEHESAGTISTPIRSNEHGNIIAVDLLTIRGRNRAMDSSGHVTARRIAVYDIEAGKQLASIPVNSNPRYRFQFDLSPDGRWVALLEDDKVTVVDVDGPGKVR